MMNDMWAFRTAAAVVALATLTACGADSSDDKTASDASTAATPSASESPSETARPLVSLRTSCLLLFPDEGDGPLQQMIVLFTDESISPEQLRVAEDGLDTARRVAETAQPSLSEQLTVLADETQAVVDTIHEGADHDTTAMKAAGLEITTICQDNLV